MCDDGLALPTERRALERWAATLAQLLAAPLFERHAVQVQTTGPGEVVVRRFSIVASGGTPTLLPGTADAKLPGSQLCGSAIATWVLVREPAGAGPLGDGGDDSNEAYLRRLLASSGGAGGSDGAAAGGHGLPSAQEVVECLEQLLGMLRVLAPPLRLLMRLNGVQLPVRGAGSGWVAELVMPFLAHRRSAQVPAS